MLFRSLNFGDLVAPTQIGSAMTLITLGGTLVAVIVQPTVGSMSDYAVSRWGRRKPFIVAGSLIDVIFLIGIATANSVLALAAFIALLNVSTNIARGPFQGYVPDLVAEEQVGFASGLVGLMQTVGNVVGYGLVDPAQGIDDYADVDVTNGVVLFLRGKPEHYQRSVSHADKVRVARERGALAYLTATGPILHPYEARRGVTGRPNAFYGQLPPDQAIPGAWISTALAEQLLADADGTHADRLRTIQDQLNKAPVPRSAATSQYAALRWNTTAQEGLLTNTLGMIPGTGPEAILIGAHRDHFGRPAGLLFAGADDNASGTAVMLEVARALAKSGLRPKRTILFVSFSGEENGLLGSRLYISRPPIPLSQTKAMINIDHAGIGNGRLTVGVTGLEKAVAGAAGQAADLTDKLDIYGFFPGGDHVPFKEAGVPPLTVVSGGVHPHYHQTTDTADTVSPHILLTAARYVLALGWHLGNEP